MNLLSTTCCTKPLYTNASNRLINSFKKSLFTKTNNDNAVKHHISMDLNYWLVLATFHLFVCNSTLYKADTSLRRTARADPEGVWLRQSLFIGILQLLDKKKRATMADLSESMECLCYLMKTVGPKLDIPKAKVCISTIQKSHCS